MRSPKNGLEKELERLVAVRKEKTGLPVNIFVDDYEFRFTYDHDPGIVFQLDTDYNIIGHKFARMDIDGNIKRDSYFNQNNKLTEEELNGIKTFVSNNKYYIKTASLFSEKFLDRILIKGTEEASEERKNKLKEVLDYVQDKGTSFDLYFKRDEYVNQNTPI